jgi:ERCC4-type nuclease
MTQCGDYVWKDHDDLVELDNGKFYHSEHTMYSEYEETMILIEETVTCVINEEIHQDNSIRIDLCVAKIIELGFTQENADYIASEQDLDEMFTVTDNITEKDLIEHLLKQ